MARILKLYATVVFLFLAFFISEKTVKNQNYNCEQNQEWFRFKKFLLWFSSEKILFTLSIQEPKS
jgi:hypothetical protein